MAQAGIEKLDAPTRVKLRSSQILTSLPQIVSELVQNSIDAGATAIDIGVDCEEWICWVKDDGSGITKEGLFLLANGSEEGRYGSSKSYQSAGLNTVSTFGFRGEALASAADLGCLEISSRTARSRDTWSIITKSGKCLYSGPAVRWRKETSGTVVCVRDAFYNLPVRRLSHLPPARTLDQIRQDLEIYSVIFPQISFTFENTHDEPGSSRGRVLRILKTSSSLNTFRNLYGRALAEHVESIDFQSDGLKLEGFISLNGAYSKGYQFLYVNRHPIAHCELHQAIDSVFRASTFGKNALDEDGEIYLPRSSIRRSPRKSEKMAVYVLNIVSSPEQLDNCLEPAKAHVQFRNNDAVLALLSTAVTTFLIKHGFLLPDQMSSQSGSNRDSPVPRKRRKMGQNDDSVFLQVFDSNEAPSVGRGERNLMVRSPPQLCTTHTSDDQVPQMTWTDPQTGETFIVDSRTGNSYPQTEESSGEAEFTGVSRDRYPRRTIPCCADVIGTQSKTDKARPPEWLQKALRENRTYQVGENMIQKLSSGLLNETVEQPFTVVHKFHEFRSALAASVSQKHHYRFRKQDLRRAVVINQVDTKFIACIIEDHFGDDGESLPATDTPSAKGHVLILVDQHAADERIRVERFLNDLCSGFLRSRNGKNLDVGVQVKELSPPLPVLLTLHEAQRLTESLEVQAAFRSWGFKFEIRKMLAVDEISSDNSSTDSGYTQVLVRSIPEVVGDKLLLGDELRSLVKGFLGQLESDGFPSSVKTPIDQDEDEFSWLKALRWCPRELLDLVNSKACRGAIMFNDPLGISQCENLIRRLSDTAFPFQCAHGRPSVVPLTNLGMSPTKYKGSLRWSRLDDGDLGDPSSKNNVSLDQRE